MKRLLLMLIMCMGFTMVNAQLNCGTHEYMEAIKAADPNYQQKHDNMEQQILDYVAANRDSKDQIIMEIPIVVHVVYRKQFEAEQNLSDDQIHEQIDILNRDFRKLNADIDSVNPPFLSITADMQMEFCLKEITRTESEMMSFNHYNNNVKSDFTGGKSPWNTKQYLNMWICDLSGGLLGYAQFPTLGADSTDGVVVDYLTIGEDTSRWELYPNYAGRVLQHEVGHWINLRHIWGDGNCNATDFVDDTPDQNGNHRDCPIGDSTCGSMDLVTNYMDYVNTWCMRCFTEGQKLRAWGSMSLFRSELVNNNCDIVNSVDAESVRELDIKVYPSMTAQFVNVEIPNLNGDKIDILIFDVQGKILMNKSTTQNRVRLNLNAGADGIYFVKINYQGKITTNRVILNKNSRYGGSIYDSTYDDPEDVLEFKLDIKD